MAEFESILYIFGLVVVILYIFFGMDDLIWDVFSTIKKSRLIETDKIPIATLDDVPPRLLGLVIAAWHEENVLAQVVDNIIASMHYPRSMYHIFLAVYPNDAETIAVVEALTRRHKNVHMVVNPNPGPTCKANNINIALDHIRAFEEEHGWKFISITVHDAEDVVHPYEFKITNYLMREYDALQFPVFPLMKMPRFRNYFKDMTTNTYADEFAENHYRTMVARDFTSAFVPSAGTGFVLSHKVLEAFRTRMLFPEGSLTEDYKLSLTLHQEGFQMHYVLEKVPRIWDDGTVQWDYISTRSMFPTTFKTAVRQKTRWIYGITMQSLKLREIFTTKDINFISRYSMYKDIKAKIANLLILPGYFVFGVSIVSLVLGQPTIYPMYSFSWYLSLVLTVMMLERQILRGLAIKNVYGARSMVMACFLPPLLPIRLIWGNIINLVATLRAWRQYFFGNPKEKSKDKKEQKIKNKASKKGKVAWSKTDHEFLPPTVLRRYYRNMGDVLLEKEYITAYHLKEALDRSREERKRIGVTLLHYEYVTETQLLGTLANVQHTTFIPVNENMVSQDYAEIFDQPLLETLVAFPLLKTEDGFVFVLSESSPMDTIDALRLEYGINVIICYALHAEILRALKLLYGERHIEIGGAFEEICHYYDCGQISYSQAILAISFCNDERSAENILQYMGLLPLPENDEDPPVENSGEPPNAYIEEHSEDHVLEYPKENLEGAFSSVGE